MSSAVDFPSVTMPFVKQGHANEEPVRRRLPVGAEVQPEGDVHFRVWAPASNRVSVILGEYENLTDGQEHLLAAEADGYWSGRIAEARAGMHYRYRLDSGEYPDPASRFQPLGPEGPSRIVEPGVFEWGDDDWLGVPAQNQVLYEMHIGTFTPEGTWAAAMAHLPYLAELGVTVLEIMPVNDFPGRFGWGYDGVNFYAPTRLYGEPDDFRRFVDRAHSVGIGVILDVVYNHVGTVSSYLRPFSPHYFSSRYDNEWGDPLNFDDEHSAPVREFFIENAGYWIDEFHCDGLRLDATQQIFDASPVHLVTAVTERARLAAGRRVIYVVGENEPQLTALVRPVKQGGHGLDALWNDDFHHAAVVALTGRNEAYYSDYRGAPQEFISAAKWGYLFQGQRYQWQKKPRGTAGLDLTPANFVDFMQNHDQVANSLWGRRVHQLASPARVRAMTALLLLGPNTPMIFQGQEFAASTPFHYFADQKGEMIPLVAGGRISFLNQFPSIAAVDAARLIPSPEKEDTFTRCKLDHAERETNAEVLDMHRDLLRLRREDPLLGKAQRGTYDGAVLGPAVFCLRFFGRAGEDRLLIVNLGMHAHIDPAPEPLLAPPTGHAWQVAWSSEDPSYGGGGTQAPCSDDNWHVAAETTVLLTPIPSL